LPACKGCSGRTAPQLPRLAGQQANYTSGSPINTRKRNNDNGPREVAEKSRPSKPRRGGVVLNIAA
jgi:cytochrome c553